MRRFLPLSSALVALSVTVSSSAAAPSDVVVDVPSASRISNVNPVDTARSLLIRSASIPPHVTLTAVPQRSAGGLRVFRFRQTHNGLSVYGRGASLTVDVNGVVRIATSKIEDRLPASTTPKLPPSEAAKIAAARSGLDASASNARLLLWPTALGARLAYAVLPPSLLPIPYAPLVVVDAETGATLTVINLVQFKNLASVYEFNPIASPNPIEVALPIDDPFTSPQNDLLVSYNCVDNKAVKQINVMGLPITAHVCDLEQTAQADPSTGDYTQYVRPDDTSGGDPFAQVSVFYHAAKAYDFFRAIEPGFELDATAKPLFLIANLMIPAGLMEFDLDSMADPDLPLEPFPNAMSVPWDPQIGDLMSLIWPEITGAALLMGQGEHADFGYDGDVIYHEFGHAVVNSTIGLVGWWHLDSQGATASPSAMNEALADLFSSAITGDALAGEYAASDFGGTEIRNLDNANTCPANLAGEVHYDSEFFSAPLWKTRAALSSDADRFAFDQAVYSALLAAPSGDLGYEDLADLLVSSLGSSPLGAGVADDLEAEYTARGVLPSCKRTLTWDGTPIRSESAELALSFIAPGKGSFATGSLLPYAPGFFQVEVPLPDGTTTLDATYTSLAAGLSFGSLPIGNGDPAKPAFIVSFDTPIAFDLSTGFSSNTGDAVEAAKIANAKFGSSLDVPPGAKTAYVMFVNMGDQDARYINLAFEPRVEVPEDAGVDGGESDAAQPDAAVAQDADPDPGPGASPSNDDDGCGCRAAGSGDQSGLGVSLFALAALAFASRRRISTILR